MKQLLLATGLLCLLCLTGCETLKAANRDLQSGSDWFEQRVDETRK